MHVKAEAAVKAGRARFTLDSVPVKGTIRRMQPLLVPNAAEIRPLGLPFESPWWRSVVWATAVWFCGCQVSAADPMPASGPAVNALSKTTSRAAIEDSIKEVTHDLLFDRIYGGWGGMLIGGLEGLPHEFKYTEQPCDKLPEFTFLEHGAHSDDDNDFEWTHLWFTVNKTRPSLPAECKVSDQAAILMRVCERLILANGGERIDRNGRSVYRMQLQAPRLIEALRAPVR